MTAVIRDIDGEPSRVGRWMSMAALAVAIVAGIGVVPAAIIAMLSQMLCDGGCTTEVRVAATAILLSPLLLIISALAGVAAYKSPTWPMILLTFIPASVVGTAFLLVSR